MDIIRPSILKNVQASKFGSLRHSRLGDETSKLIDDSVAIFGDMEDSGIMLEKSLRGEGTHNISLANLKQQAIVCGEPDPLIKTTPQGQDSDVDSGIAGCGQRVSSTSSTDTDSSCQESRNKPSYCSSELNKNHVQISDHYRSLKRNGCSTYTGNPVKGDHTVLKECNRRPPTPLTVFSDNTHSVRFDDQLPLSEQNLRRSCRKLFATLYAQRFSYSLVPSQSESKFDTGDTAGNHRSRSQTLPSSELRKNYPTAYERPRPSRVKTPTDCARNKENFSAAVFSNSRKAVSWNLSLPGNQMPPSNAPRLRRISASSNFTQKELQFPENIPIRSAVCSTSLKASTDSGLGGCHSKCNCQYSPRNSGGYSSQSSTSSNSSTSTGCCCFSDNPQVVPLAPHTKNPALFKSNSCSTLPRMLLQTFQQPEPVVVANGCNPHSQQQAGNQSLHKTSSCSNLMNRTLSVPVENVPMYNDSMMHVYAQVASVIPDETTIDKSKNETFSRTNSNNDHIYDTLRSPPLALPTYPLPKHRASTVTFRAYKNSKRSAISIHSNADNDLLMDNRTTYESSFCQDAKEKPTEFTRMPTPSEYMPLESRLVPYQIRNRQENPYGSTVAAVRPITTQATFTQTRLKSALKQPRPMIQQAVSHLPDRQMSQNGSVSTIQSEAEYAMVDRSKKNRFSSLPALDQCNSNSITEDDKEMPPVPPKKNLHKSEIDLYRSRSSSPKKSFLERVNGLTKSAKHVFQRAFSTERIYRPEKEERMEASHLNRSKSFMKGLRASISKKRKKNKPPMAEVVPQSSSNPLWDEHSSGMNAPIHVRGQLLQLNLDGSQVVELSKPYNRPYGFFVARGRVRNSKGVFVSRMRDQETQRQLAGLLDIGDEILEIEGLNVKNASIMEVNDLMTNKNTLLLTVLPYICRKDI